jgi:hypothetical protein
VLYWKKVEGKTYLGNQGEDWRILLKRLLNIRYECLNWVHLRQNRDEKGATVRTTMNLRVSHKAGNSLII